ncbi:hypothetical protein [Dethiobacter alkaliphilus]|nr:hypothetical protein [Dethiobacter alkaliphilus]MCW3488767.1 hypothetical protein [Dethiobacter alkaliphilus]
MEVLVPLGIIGVVLIYNILSMTLDEKTYAPPRPRKRKRKRRRR